MSNRRIKRLELLHRYSSKFKGESVKQFCEVKSDCVFGADGKCVFCDRKGKPAIVTIDGAQIGTEVGHGLNESLEECPDSESDLRLRNAL